MINKFLLVDDTFTSEMHLKQHRFSYNACELFTKNKEQYKKLKK